eukprot:COSAG02_NODE_702_length_18327_cov_85.154597_12_plen_95_part_00
MWELFEELQYDLSGDPGSVQRQLRRFIQRAFNVDERGLKYSLGQLQGFCVEFNKNPRNGHAELILKGGFRAEPTLEWQSDTSVGPELCINTPYK